MNILKNAPDGIKKECIPHILVHWPDFSSLNQVTLSFERLYMYRKPLN